MAKAGPAYDLSDAEKRDLIALIQQGKSLPEKYRFVLFEGGVVYQIGRAHV